MRLGNQFKKLLCMDKDMLNQVSSEVAEENQSILRVMSFIAMLAFAIMVAMALSLDFVRKNLSIYLVYFLFCVLSYFLARSKESEKVVNIHVNAFIFFILIFGVILGTVFSNEATVSYIVLMFAVPLLFISPPVILNSVIIATVFIYFVMAIFYQSTELLRFNMVNIFMFGLISMIVSSYLTNIKIQRTFYYKKNILMEQTEKLKEEEAATHDKLTGCKNRNAMSWAYEEDFSKGQSVAVIMCDLNGLKQINDLQGHKAGDSFLLRVSDILVNTFGKDNVYRIGGDEFIVILIGKDTKDVDAKVEALRLSTGNTVSIGVNVCNSAGIKFDDIFKDADNRMYREKQRYYAQHPEKKDAHQAIMEYQDIIAEAGLGTWHIILKDGAKPRMQVDEKMSYLLGIDSLNMSEEEIYSSWYDRILPEAVPSVNASVNEMIEGNFSENTYQWHHPKKGIIYVRCGGTSTTLTDGTKVLRGYHGDVTGIVVEEQKHKIALENAEKTQREVIEVFDSIHNAMGSANWHMVFDEEGNMTECVWGDKLRQLLGYQSLTDFPDEFTSWSDLLHPDDKENVLKAYWDTVNDVIGVKTYNVEYRLKTKDKGYCWYKSVGRLTRTSSGLPKIFYGLFMESDRSDSE